MNELPPTPEPHGEGGTTQEPPWFLPIRDYLVMLLVLGCYGFLSPRFFWMGYQACNHLMGIVFGVCILSVLLMHARRCRSLEPRRQWAAVGRLFLWVVPIPLLAIGLLSPM